MVASSNWQEPVLKAVKEVLASPRGGRVDITVDVPEPGFRDIIIKPFLRGERQKLVKIELEDIDD